MAVATMRAIVAPHAGTTSVLKLETVPLPKPSPGEILIRVKAFGINRSELFARLGYSPVIPLSFPRILGIEAAGVVESAPGTDFHKGDVVVTAMGGMGRSFDGGYAEYTVVPANQVLRVNCEKVFGSDGVRWDILGALPELMQSTWGSLFKSLELKRGDRLLIRGGTSSIGIAAILLAKDFGAFVVATTRNPTRAQFLASLGTDEVIVDNGVMEPEVRKKWPGGFNKILELVGVSTLEDSLRCAGKGGIVCMAGVAGNKWTCEDFSPMEAIPTAVKLTTYLGTAADLLATPMDSIAAKVASGTLKLPIKAFKMENIAEVHRLMEEQGAMAKMVVLTDD